MQLTSEKELEDYLYAYNQGSESHPLRSYKEGYGIIFKQLKIEGYGVIDLLLVEIIRAQPTPIIAVTIVELKKDKIDLNALGQISRYKIAIERFFKELRNLRNVEYFENLEIKGLLIGSEYADGDICYTVDAIDWLECQHYDLDMASGITFNTSKGWFNNKECFENLHEEIKVLKNKYIELYKSEWKARRALNLDKK